MAQKAAIGGKPADLPSECHGTGRVGPNVCDGEWRRGLFGCAFACAGWRSSRQILVSGKERPRGSGRNGPTIVAPGPLCHSGRSTQQHLHRLLLCAGRPTDICADPVSAVGGICGQTACEVGTGHSEQMGMMLCSLFQMGAEVPFSLALGPGLLFIGFGDGTIRALGLEGMEMLLEFGKPLALHVDPAEGGCSERQSLAEDKKLDNCVIPFHFWQIPGCPFAGFPCPLRCADRTLQVLYPTAIGNNPFSDRSLFHWLLQPTSAESQRIPPPVRLRCYKIPKNPISHQFATFPCWPHF